MRRFIQILLLASLAVSFARAYVLDKFHLTDYLVPWPSPSALQKQSVPMQIKVPTTTIASEGKTYAQVVQEAMTTWNAQLNTVQFVGTVVNTQINPPNDTHQTYQNGNEINEIVIDTTIDGEPFDPTPSADTTTLAVTVSYSRGPNRSESDIVFNAAIIWNSYTGPLQSNIQDMRRVVLHELGHALGLNHPDQASPVQNVTAIMNSMVSNIDSLQTDDINGARVMYGAPGVVPANDNFANASTLTLAGSTAVGTSTNVSASKEAGEPSPFSGTGGTNGGRSIWWKWTATGSGQAKISTYGSTFDTTLVIYTGSTVSSLTLIDGNDDEEPGGPGVDNLTRKRTSVVTFNAVNGTTYYFNVDGWDGAEGPATITLTFPIVVNTPPGITSHPGNQTVNAGNTATFSVGVSGIPTPTLQWQVLPTGTGTWSNLNNTGQISGVNTSTLTVANTAVYMSGYQLRCVATNSVGTATSNAATLTVINPVPPTITTQPVSRTVAKGNNVTFSVAATGPGTITFTWLKDGSQLANTGHITGSTGPTLFINSVQPADAGSYVVGVNNQYGSTPSNAVTLNVVGVAGVVGTDFNNDGKSDLVWQNRNTGERLIWLMNGTGFSSSVAITGMTSEWQIAATGDFNGDGQGDLLWTNTTTHEWRVWLMNGTVLNSSISVTARTADWTVTASGDFNSDGKSDLVWTNTSTGAREIWLMNGGTPGATLSLGTVPVEWTIAGVGDFNNDGQADLIWENTITGERRIWLMNGTATTSVVSLGTVSTDWSIVGSGDFNNDGKGDLVWLNRMTGESSVWLMNGTAYGSAVSVGSVNLDWMLGRPQPRGRTTAGDFDGDGKSDLIWQNVTTGQVFVWLMNGTSTASSTLVGTMPPDWSVAAIADFNGDGRSDVVWQNAAGQWRLWTMNGTAIVSDVSPAITFPGWAIVGAGDFNADGKADLVLQRPDGARAIWFMNGSAYVSQYGWNVSPEWSISAVGDFNGDKKCDLVWTNTTTGERRIWLMNGSTAASDASLGTVDLNWTLVGSGDFNGDNKSDLIWTNTATGERAVWLMNGASFGSNVGLGTVGADWVLDRPQKPWRRVPNDFDGDGQSDLLWRNSTTGECVIWLMNGTGYKSNVSLGTVPTAWSIAATGDFNGDGKVDIVWENHVTGERAFWLMNGTTFGSTVSLGVVGTEWSIIAAGDCNSDGKTDLVWRNSNTTLTSYWLMNGTTLASAVMVGDIGYLPSASGDFNGDGLPDFLGTLSTDGYRYVAATTPDTIVNGTLTSGGTLGTISTVWQATATGDFNNDGKADVVWTNSNTGERLIWLLDGAGHYVGGASLGTISTDWQIMN